LKKLLQCAKSGNNMIESDKILVYLKLKGVGKKAISSLSDVQLQGLYDVITLTGLPLSEIKCYPVSKLLELKINETDIRILWDGRVQVSDHEGNFGFYSNWSFKEYYEQYIL